MRSSRWLLNESGLSFTPGYGVFLSDFLGAIGVPSREQLVEVCPQPALLELPPAELVGGGSVFFDADPDYLAGEVERRLDAVTSGDGVADIKLFFLLSDEAEQVVIGNSLRHADVKLPDPDVGPRHAQLSRRRGLWRVMDLESERGTRLEEGRLRAGIPLPIVGGQRLAFGSYRTLFLEPATLHTLIQRRRRLRFCQALPPEGARVRASLGLFEGLDREALAALDLPPILLQVPSEGAASPAGNQAQTRRLSAEFIAGLRRSKRTGQAILHAATPRQGGGEPIDVGRAETCGLILPEASVSKRHAQLHRLPSGRYGVLDLGSNNGTFVNGRRITSGELTPLTPGCQVWFSSYRALFLSPQQAFALLNRLPAKRRSA